MKDLENKNKKKPFDTSEGDENLNETTSDETVEQVTEEVIETVEENIDQANDDTQAQHDSEIEGAPGEKPEKKKKNSFLGSPSVIDGTPSGISLMSMGVTPSTNVGTSVNDIDKFERNQNRAQREFERVEAHITREGTRAVDAGENNISGTPANNTIYPLESEVTTETVAGKFTRVPHAHPRSRETGTLMIENKSLAKFANTIVYGPNSQAQKKGVQNNFLLFNEFDSEGYITSRFRHVRQGLFAIKGIRPFITATQAASSDTIIGYVNRDDINGGSVLVPVVESAHETFKVLDLTPHIDDIKEATNDLAEYVVANETKMAYGRFEQIQVAISRLREMFTNEKTVLEYPEFSMEDRSSFNYLDPNIRAGSIDISDDSTPDIRRFDLSLYNRVDEYASLMSDLAQSEVIHAMIRSNIHNIKDNLKFYRGLEGKDPEYLNFRRTFKGDPNEIGGYSFPTMADYAATKASTRAYDSLAKWIYGFPQFWRTIEDSIESIDDMSVRTTILSKIGVQQQAVEVLVDSLGIGLIHDNDGVTTAELIKDSDENTIVIGFNPNDLISYDTDNSNSYLHDEFIKPHLNSGYINFRTRETTGGSQSAFVIAPTWLEMLVDVFSNSYYMSRTLESSNRSGERVPTKVKTFFDVTTNFLPWRWDHKNTHWIDVFLLEGLAITDSGMKHFNSPSNAYTRWLVFIEQAGLLDLFNGNGVISVNDMIDKILNNDQLWNKPHRRNPRDFDKLWDSALENLSIEPFDVQVANFSKVQLKKHDEENEKGPVGTALLMQPSRLDLAVHSLTDMAPDLHEDQDIEIPDLTFILRNSNLNTGLAASSRTFYLVPSEDEESYYVFWAKANGDPSIQPLTFKRGISYSTRSGKRFLQLTEGADPKLLGYETAPDQALFGKDGFQYVGGSDGFMLQINMSYQLAEGMDNAPIEVFDYVPAQGVTAALVPYYWFDDYVQAKNSVVELEDYGLAPSFSIKPKDNKNSLKTDKGVNIAAFRIRGLNTNESETLYESKAVSRSSVPSMYGHKLFAYRGLLDYRIDSGNYVNAYGALTAYSLTSTDDSLIAKQLQGSSVGLRSFSMTLYLPRSIYDTNTTYRFSQWNDDIDDLLDSSLINPLLTDFYDRTETRFYNHSNVVSGNSVASHNILLALANMPATLSVLTDLDSEEGDILTSYTELGFAYLVITETRAKVMSTMNDALQDFFYRHQPDFLTLVIPSDLTLSVLVDTVGNDAAAIADYSSKNLQINSEFKSRFYINDYRDYVYQRPIVSLNNRWYLPQTAVSAFAEQYFNKNQ